MSANYDRQPPPQVQPPRKRHRVFLWVYLAIQVIFLGWVIYAGVSAPQSGWSPGVGLQMGLWVHAQLGLRLTYHPGARTVSARAELGRSCTKGPCPRGT